MGDFYVIPKSADGILKVGDFLSQLCFERLFLRNPLSLPTASLQKENKTACSSKLGQTVLFFFTRKVGDSNPRYACAYTAFRVRLFRPLRQLSFLYSLQRYCFFLNYASNTLFFYLIVPQKCHLNRRSQSSVLYA